MGGGLAVQLAIHEPRLAACVVNYGPLPTNIADIQKINASVLESSALSIGGFLPAKFERSKGV